METRAIQTVLEGKELYAALGLIPRKVGKREEGRSIINRLALVIYDSRNRRVLAINKRFMYELFGPKLISKFALRAKNFWTYRTFGNGISMNDKGELIVTPADACLETLKKLYEIVEPRGYDEYHFVSDNGSGEFDRLVAIFERMERSLKSVSIDVRFYYTDKNTENSVRFYYTKTTAFDHRKLVSERIPNAILLKSRDTSKYLIGIHMGLWDHMGQFERLNKFIARTGIVTIKNCAGKPDEFLIVKNKAIPECEPGLIYYLNKDMLKYLKKTHDTPHLDQYRWYKFDSNEVDLEEMHSGLKKFVRSFNGKVRKNQFKFKIINL